MESNTSSVDSFSKILQDNPELEIVGYIHECKRTMAERTLTTLTGSPRPDGGMSLFSRINRHASRTPSWNCSRDTKTTHINNEYSDQELLFGNFPFSMGKKDACQEKLHNDPGEKSTEAFSTFRSHLVFSDRTCPKFHVREPICFSVP